MPKKEVYLKHFLLCASILMALDTKTNSHFKASSFTQDSKKSAAFGEEGLSHKGQIFEHSPMTRETLGSSHIVAGQGLNLCLTLLTCL